MLAEPVDGVPVSSPRRVSMIEVNGWYSANCRASGPILSAGTNALLKKGRIISGTPARPALSADGRNPISNATPVTSATANRLRSMVPITCAFSTAARDTLITRSRLMNPVVMSELTAIAVGHRARRGSAAWSARSPSWSSRHR
ncbi:hypothetical protein [Nonomuraea sp. NPDC049625]|uniref:hypothetical protein n=1 Tax=Nonomuraea sp. NPDC049625 TaxID=3155775 RepID=UPI0034154C40